MRGCRCRTGAEAPLRDPVDSLHDPWVKEAEPVLDRCANDERRKVNMLQISSVVSVHRTLFKLITIPVETDTRTRLFD
jgi:hypothetical protein